MCGRRRLLGALWELPFLSRTPPPPQLREVGKLLCVYQLPPTSSASVSSVFLPAAHLSSLPLTNSFSFISSSSSFPPASIPVFIPGCEKGVFNCVCPHPYTHEHYSSCREGKSVALGIVFVFSYGMFPDNAPRSRF